MAGEYSDAPPSITELRADKEGDMTKWVPRDVLISLLRSIDSGEINGVDALVVAFRRREDGESFTNFFMAAPDIHTALGLLNRAAYKINES